MDAAFKSERETAFKDSAAGVLVSFATGDEVYREYDWFCPVSGEQRVYRVERPVSVDYTLGGTTHRVWDNNDVLHILPAPGHLRCVVRLKHQPDVV